MVCAPDDGETLSGQNCTNLTRRADSWISYFGQLELGLQFERKPIGGTTDEKHHSEFGKEDLTSSLALAISGV